MVSKRDDRKFAAVPDEMIRGGGVSPRGVQVFALLLRYAGPTDVAWPHQSTMAKEIGVSRPTIQRAVGELRTTGWVTVKRRGLMPGVEYRLHKTPLEAPNEAAEASQDPVSDASRMMHSCASSVMHPYEGEPVEGEPEEKNTSCSSPPPRPAVRREAQAARDREDSLDPAKSLHLWDEETPREMHGAPVKHPTRPKRHVSADSPMGLALAWRARMQEAHVAGALDANLKALAALFKTLLAEGVTTTQIRAMTSLYASADGMRNPSVAPWRHFLYQRHLLLAKVRRAEQDRRTYQDPDAYVYVPPTPEQRAEADRRLAEELAAFRARR